MDIGKVTQAKDVTQAGYAADARELNAAVANSLAARVESAEGKFQYYYALAGGEVIPAGADLNSYIRPGSYYCAETERAKTILNFPFEQGIPFTMWVDYALGFAWPRQTIRIFNGAAIYHRFMHDEIWDPWRVIEFKKYEGQ